MDKLKGVTKRLESVTAWKVMLAVVYIDKWHRLNTYEEHGAVNNGVVSIAVHRSVRLEGVTSVVAGQSDVGVGSVKLADPHGVSVSSVGTAGSDVGVVGSSGHTGSLPLEENLLAGEAEGLAAVVGDGGLAAVADDVGVQARLVGGDGRDGRVTDTAAGDLEVSGVVGGEAVGVGVVDNVQSGEVLPCETSGVCRARADVGSEISP